MKFKALAVIAACSLLTVACGNKGSNDNGTTRAVQQTDTGDTVTLPVIDPSGAEVASSKISSLTVTDNANPIATEEDLAKLLAEYPDLGRDVATLKTIDKVVETDAKGIDLYAGDVLVASMMADAGGVWTVSKSNATFTPASILVGMSGDAQQAVMNSLTFGFHQCISVPGEQEQGQQEQKGEVAKEECADVTVVILLQREEQKQEEKGKGQEQKQEGKGQEQQNPGEQEEPKP